MSVTSIEGLYVGYFGRAADPAGLNYWLGQEAAGLTDTQIASSFAVQPETTAMYPALLTPTLLDASPAAEANFINAIYTDLFGHAADTAGLSYWQGQLTAGVNPGIMVSQVISGAQGTDTAALTAKEGVATSYTNAVLTASPTVTWSKNDVTSSKSILATVTTAATASATGTSIAAAITADQSGNTGVTGTTLTLGGGGQVFSPTATGGLQTTGGNLIRGVLGGTAPATATSSQLTTSDSITGAGGFNTLSAVLDNEAIVNPVLAGIQAVNLAPGLANQTFTGASSSGILTLSVAGGLFGGTGTDGEPAAATTLNVVGITTATALGMMNATGATNLDNIVGTFTGLAATGNQETLVLSGNAGGAFDTIPVSGNGINTYNIQSTGKANTVTINGGDTLLTTENISGSAALTILNANPLVTTINASTSTGAVSVTSTAAAVKVTETAGSGADTLDASLYTKASTLVGGSGNDTLIFNGAVSANTVTVGSGLNTVKTQPYATSHGITNVNTGGNTDTTSAGSLAADVEVVNGYVAGSTTIDLTGLAANAYTLLPLTGTQLSTALGKSSILTAVQYVAGLTAAGQVADFAFGSDEYVYEANTGAAFTAGDGLLKIAGAAATFKSADVVLA
jgi:hypothetical protein